MVAITATNSATPSLQASLSKTRLQQARREAAQAESVAQDLRAQVNNAESDVQRTQSRVRALATSGSSADDPTYRAQRETAPSGLRPASQNLLVDLYQRASALREPATSPLLAANSPAVQNTQGQLTGRIVNIRA